MCKLATARGGLGGGPPTVGRRRNNTWTWITPCNVSSRGTRRWGDEEKAPFKAWRNPLGHSLKHESAAKTILQLDVARAGLPASPAREAVAKEVADFHKPQPRPNCRAARRVGEPIGSGPVEAPGRQGRCRFKRTGQFWSTTGREALLCRETFWRQER
ncbi:MAG TPA: hypothetical protein VI136_27105 [Verrucomicrobiae bacterium]